MSGVNGPRAERCDWFAHVGHLHQRWTASQFHCRQRCVSASLSSSCCVICSFAAQVPTCDARMKTPLNPTTGCESWSDWQDTFLCCVRWSEVIWTTHNPTDTPLCCESLSSVHHCLLTVRLFLESATWIRNKLLVPLRVVFFYYFLNGSAESNPGEKKYLPDRWTDRRTETDSKSLVDPLPSRTVQEPAWI